MTMQGFYEIYDIYGDNEEAWKPYERNNTINNTTSKFSDIMKNIDLDEVQKHITSAQKALGMVSDLTTKNANSLENAIKGPLTSRPLNKFFED